MNKPWMLTAMALGLGLVIVGTLLLERPPVIGATERWSDASTHRLTPLRADASEGRPTTDNRQPTHRFTRELGATICLGLGLGTLTVTGLHGLMVHVGKSAFSWVALIPGRVRSRRRRRRRDRRIRSGE